MTALLACLLIGGGLVFVGFVIGREYERTERHELPPVRRQSRTACHLRMVRPVFDFDTQELA